MGAAQCSDCNADNCSAAFQQVTPNIVHRRKGSKRSVEYDSETESDHEAFNMDEDISSPLARSKSGFELMSLVDQQRLRQYDAELTATLKAQYRESMLQGQDSLPIHLNELHPALNLLQTTFENGDKSLHLAVRNKQYSVMVYLLSMGASPKDQNERTGDTPLHIAVQRGHLKMATFLLRFEMERSTKLKNEEGLDAMAVAEQFGRRDMMELLSPESLQLLQMIKSEAKTLCQSMDDGLLSTIMDSIDRYIDSGRDTADSPSAAETSDFVAPQSPMGGVIPTDHFANVTDNEGAEVSEGDGHSGHLEIDFFSEDIVKLPPHGDTAAAADRSREEEVALNELLTRFQELCGNIASERVKAAYKDMIRLEANRLDLRVLESWIEERDTAPPHQFSMRWVVAKDAHFMWSNKKLMVTDTRNEDERSRWNECVHLMMISGVDIVEEDPSEREFRFNVETFGDVAMTKQYVWKAKSKEERDYWTEGLKEHVQSFRNMVTHLSVSSLME